MRQDAARTDFAYDQVPYPGAADPDTHPRRIYAVARLLGMQPAEISNCRMLELGCAAGRHLLPMAEAYPDSQFLGIDLAASRIEEAKQLAESLGLKNVEFRHGSLTEVDESWGQYDYIICKGVLTWVDPDVRQHVFKVFHTNLAQNGVGLASYNVLPGWRHRAVTRDAMQYFVGHLDDLDVQVQRARSLLEFLAEATSADLPHGQTYRQDRSYLRQSSNDYLFHDFLTGDNSPIYFHQFYNWLSQHDLQYVGETNVIRNSFAYGSAETQAVLRKFAFAERCQMLDFLRNESYRKSLVCQPGVTLDVAGAEQRLKELHLSLIEIPSPAEFDIAGSDPVTLQYSLGRLNLAVPFGKAAMHHLINVFPRAVSVRELFGACRDLLADAGSPELVDSCTEDQLSEAMIASIYAGLVQVCSHPPEFVDALAERPRALPLARLMAERHGDAVNQFHETARMPQVMSFVLSQLDGTRTRDDLIELVSEAFASDQLQADEQTIPPAERVDAALEQIRGFYLLV